MNRPKQALFALGALFLNLAPIGYAQQQAEAPSSKPADDNVVDAEVKEVKKG